MFIASRRGALSCEVGEKLAAESLFVDVRR